MLSPRAEELLSYLIGLGPVGSTIEIHQKALRSDLRMNTHVAFYKYLNELMGKRFVRRVACGNAGSTGLLQVLRRA